CRHEHLRRIRIKRRHKAPRDLNVLGIQAQPENWDSQVGSEMGRQTPLPVVDRAAAVEMRTSTHVVHLCSTVMYPVLRFWTSVAVRENRRRPEIKGMILSKPLIWLG